jgi:hypothetical protein
MGMYEMSIVLLIGIFEARGGGIDEGGGRSIYKGPWPGATQIKAMKALKIEDFCYNSLIH